MSTLITGATGFIGGQLALRLAGGGEPVRALCRATADTRSLRHDNIRIVPGDVRDAAAVERAMEGCERIFHLAAYARNWARNPQTFIEINVGGLRNVLNAARKLGARKVVFTSSALTLGPSTGRPVDESTARETPPFTDYEDSKLQAEQLAHRYALEGGPVTIVNPSRVFGPGLLTEGNSVTRMIQWYLAGRWRLLPSGGNQLGNWAFIDDVVRGHLLAMEQGRSGERYVLGGENTSLKNLFNLIAEISGRRYRLFPVPFTAAMTAAVIEQVRAEWFEHYPLITPGWVRCFGRDWACASTKAERELGYRVTQLCDALRKTIESLHRSREAALCATF